MLSNLRVGSEARLASSWSGYALATSIAAKSHVGIVQAMLRALQASPNYYLSGPVCVAESERGNGLAGMLYQETRKRLPNRAAMSFVRSDNKPSLRANRKMGKKEFG
jgi:hypothetical protein